MVCPERQHNDKLGRFWAPTWLLVATRANPAAFAAPATNGEVGRFYGLILSVVCPGRQHNDKLGPFPAPTWLLVVTTAKARAAATPANSAALFTPAKIPVACATPANSPEYPESVVAAGELIEGVAEHR